MTDPDDPPMSPDEAAGVERLTAQLDATRPVPDAGFRGRLDAAVTGEVRRRHLRPRPSRLWARVLGLSAAGTALLVLAIAQL